MIMDAAPNGQVRRLAVVTATFVIQAATILILFPFFDSVSFAVSVLPAGTAGWIFGRKWGFLFGLLSVIISLLCQAILGILNEKYLFQSLFGGPTVILVGAAFGHLRDVDRQAKRDTQARLDAEESRRKLEQKLQQSQKMEAVGTLAGGIAHDMNNILAIIMSSLSLLKHDIQTENCNEEDVDNALDACRRGRELTRNLLGFARKGAYVKQALDLNTVMSKVLHLISPVLSKNIRVESNPAEDLTPIFGDRGQIEQALFNICINAAEAVSDEGRIRIRTWNGTVADRAMAAQYGLVPQGLVFVEISDNGQGMDPDLAARVFEPFFTTKPSGHGTGLGLAMAYNTMKQHDGAIDITSIPNTGTTITLLFPGTPGEAVQSIEPTATEHPFRPSKGRVLLVDDEPLIRKSCTRMLSKLGYEVVTVENGEAALQTFEEDPMRFEIVILDFIMPGINGSETFDRLIRIRSDVRVFISSGYSKDGQIENILRRGGAGFIPKPFELDQLATLLATDP